MPWVGRVWRDHRVVIEHYTDVHGPRWLAPDGSWTRDARSAWIFEDEAQARQHRPPAVPTDCVTIRGCRSHPDLRDPRDPAYGGPIPARAATVRTPKRDSQS